MKALYALVGMQHRGQTALVRSLPDGEPLTLVREPNNEYDALAVQVWARDVHVGYIKGTQVRPLALAMDARPVERAPAKLSTRNGERWPMVEVDL